MMNNNDDDLGKALIALKDNLDLMDQQSLAQVGGALTIAVESLAPAQRAQYRDEIASLISALESRILDLEQEIDNAKAEMEG